ncbi:MAG: hypothetical protein HC786_27645 [Richelia sp. CSU_2_1]|nr:hypothetical protein [Microcoleus sp. SU_5_6]NJL68375.1 hypothetical protein [Microcoleus sp. SM1_3_4]NJR25644.1 hypothetical protein [Richelia sp. CSU_2_1]
MGKIKTIATRSRTIAAGFDMKECPIERSNTLSRPDRKSQIEWFSAC